ncbi:MAG: hypothetical protein M1816_004618 [Peltula sp. TS41687]|nr:MAG: hypothetical protein M1816_004618 [Peltula sp. TS41687]
MPLNITIDSSSTTNGSDHSTSFSDDSSGTGVQVSPSSGFGSQEYADSLDGSDGWVVYPDEINPSDSASRPRTSNQHRTTAAPVNIRETRPSVPHRQSSRRVANERLARHPPPRAHRPPLPIAPESVDPSDDYPGPGYARGHPPPPPHIREHVRAHGRYGVVEAPVPYYPSSYTSYETYAGNSIVPVGAQHLMPVPAQGGYGYAHNPYSPAHGPPAGGYFPPTHHHPAPAIGPPSPRPAHAHPHGYGHPHAHAPAHSPTYPAPDMLGYGPSPGYYYGPQGYGIPPGGISPAMNPHLFYHPFPAPSPPKQSTPPPAPPAPAAPDTSKDDEKFARLEKLLMDQKLEADAKEVRAQKAAEEREAAAKRAAEQIAAAKLRADAEAAAAAMALAEAAREEAKVQAEAAKAEAEAAKAEVEATKLDLAAKLAEEAIKAQEAAKQAAETAEAEKKAAAEAAAAEAKAAAEAAAAKPKAEKKKPIKFKDAVGRKFSFPFHLCQSWAGMEELIRQAFLHVDVIGPHVAEGHYDLIGPSGDIILPQVWETVVEPDWTITMKMWPIPEPPPAPDPPKEPEKPEEKKGEEKKGEEKKGEEKKEAGKAEPQPEQVVLVAPGKPVVKVTKKAKAAAAAHAAAAAQVPPPPPPAPGEAGDTTVAPSPAVIVVGGGGSAPTKKTGQARLPPLLMWTAGNRSRNSKKVEKKPEEGTPSDVVCRVM